MAHSTTKGEAREEFVLDVLQSILPQRLSLVRRPVIIDATDYQAKSFDAAIANLFDYPQLFAEGFSALMIESVKGAIEIKSNLDADAIRDIFEKAASFRRLNQRRVKPKPAGLSVAFSYACDNLNLRFLDFAVASDKSKAGGEGGADLICVLNQGLLTSISPASSSVVRDGLPNALPYLIEAKEDALLLFVYLTVSWLDWDQPSEMKEFWTYIQPSLSLVSSQVLDEEFLQAVRGDERALQSARTAMHGMGNAPFAEAYAKARKALRI